MESRTMPSDATESSGSSAWSSIPHKGWIIAVAAVVAFLLFFVALPIGWYNTVRNGLIDRETTMNAQYQANQAELDAFVKKVNEEFQVAGAKAGQLDKVLTDAVRGLYDNSLATPGKPVATGTQTPLISALVQAYPNLGGLDIYDRVVTEISAGRENFKQVQNKLLDQIRGYDSYRSKGIFHSMFVGIVGYPKLEARIGRQVFHGSAAEDQMKLIVTSKATSQDFLSGQENGINFGTTGP